MNPSTPAANWSRKMTVRLMQNCKKNKINKKKKKRVSCFAWQLLRPPKRQPTNCSRQMFSLSEPTQPQNVMINMRTPTTSSIMAGSTARHANAVSMGNESIAGWNFLCWFIWLPIAMTDLPACLTTRAYTPIAIMDMAMSCKQSAKRGEEKLRGTVDNFIAQEWWCGEHVFILVLGVAPFTKTLKKNNRVWFLLPQPKKTRPLFICIYLEPIMNLPRDE